MLGVDLGDRTGWATIDIFPNKGFTLRHGVWQHKPTRFDSASVRYDRFERNLRSELALGVTHCAFEVVHRHLGTAAAHVYGGYLATLQRVCDDMRVPLEGYAVGTIKKFATGNGAAKKPEMIRAANEFAQANIEDDNEADAVCIARLHWVNCSD